MFSKFGFSEKNIVQYTVTKEGDAKLHFEVPGATKDNIKINLNERRSVVAISYSAPSFNKQGDSSISLSSNKYDYTTAKAALKNGILTLTFKQKKEDKNPVSLDVMIEDE